MTNIENAARMIPSIESMTCTMLHEDLRDFVYCFPNDAALDDWGNEWLGILCDTYGTEVVAAQLLRHGYNS